MKNYKATHQKSSETAWIDESGNQTQYSRLFTYEKLMEKNAIKLFKDAIKVNEVLHDFKEKVREICEEVHEQYLKDKNIDAKGKGNFTWYNFDRSIKVEVSINDRITFDDMGIATCRELFDEYLNDTLKNTRNKMISKMLHDAFTTSRGKLDTKKVMNLIRYENEEDHPKFKKAMEVLKDSIRKPSSKTYFRIWAKDTAGEYQNIDLNFSSIK